MADEENENLILHTSMFMNMCAIMDFDIGDGLETEDMGAIYNVGRFIGANLASNMDIDRLKSFKIEMPTESEEWEDVDDG